MSCCVSEEVLQRLEIFQAIEDCFEYKIYEGSTHLISSSTILWIFIQLKVGKEVIFLFANEVHLIKDQNEVDKFSENMRLVLLRPVDFQTRNCFDLKLNILSNRHIDDFRDSNLMTNVFEIFFSGREGPGMQFTMADGVRFFFKYKDFFKHLYTYHLWKIHNI